MAQDSSVKGDRRGQPMHAGIFMGLGSQGDGCVEVSLEKTSCRCTGTHLHCALLSKAFLGGNISLNVSLAYPLLLDSQERIKNKRTELAVGYLDSGSC